MGFIDKVQKSHPKHKKMKSNKMKSHKKKIKEKAKKAPKMDIKKKSSPTKKKAGFFLRRKKTKDKEYKKPKKTVSLFKRKDKLKEKKEKKPKKGFLFFKAKDKKMKMERKPKVNIKDKSKLSINKVIYDSLFVLGIILIIVSGFLRDIAYLFIGLLFIFLALFIFELVYKPQIKTKHHFFYPIVILTIMFLIFYIYNLKDIIIGTFNAPLNDSWILYFLLGFLLVDLFLILKHHVVKIKQGRKKHEDENTEKHEVKKAEKKPWFKFKHRKPAVKETKKIDKKAKDFDFIEKKPHKKNMKKITVITMVLLVIILINFFIFGIIKFDSVWTIITAVLALAFLMLIVVAFLKKQRSKKEEPKKGDNETVEDDKAEEQKSEADADMSEEIDKTGEGSEEAKEKAESPKDDDVATVLKITDELLGSLPQESIDKFANSEDFKLYEKVLEKYKVK